MHRVLVCGGRDYFDQARLFAVLDHYRTEADGFAVLIHGCAPGADRSAGEWAKSRGVSILEFSAEWDLHGRAAGHIRNAQMIAEGKPTLVIAFPGGRGTRNMMTQARDSRIPVLEIPA